ncbi:natural cytotoxicity triggering receptor 3-like isoform X1 [Dipodomys spectabilis]|uniref:natural cytotoxicity triggering receptor 3-like isoform X1 n=1 Tax=Dipodomys spectabilis TaxID=105255 RepID=UPI001C540D31|nr:natural cytotoxicity triggering receptor 3-like isoform X1 [Dipodomys spectabilis]XP_042540287.1 natural cytotoxicity triggering receptor 3-like isoform X1 [Dipodomys spectabilis]XP_042540289.1 natural cytotoxicity triggering receptor 3-like isoform X1 [Dipodomys spectabilis]
MPLLPESQTLLLRPPSPTGAPSDMAGMLSLVFIMVHSGSCFLWVFQPPEIHAQEGTTALLPCSFNASQGKQTIGSVTWYRDKVAPGKQVSNMTPEFRGRLAPLAPSRFSHDHQAELCIWAIGGDDAGVYVCTVEVLGLGVGSGNGTRLLVAKGEAMGGSPSSTPDPKTQCPWSRIPPSLTSSTLSSPLPHAGPAQTSTGLLLRAGFYALSFLSVALGSTFYYQGKKV